MCGTLLWKNELMEYVIRFLHKNSILGDILKIWYFQALLKHFMPQTAIDGGIYVENRKRKLSLESLSNEDPRDRS